MTRAQRIAFAVVGVALAVVAGVIVWLTLRGDQPEAAPIPPAGAARVVVADAAIELPYVVEVPGTADGCPAATFRSPAEPVVTPSDGYAGVMLPGGDGAALTVACIGAVDEVGTPEEVVAGLWSGETRAEVAAEMAEAGFPDEAWPEPLAIERLTSPHGADILLTSRTGRYVLTDHYVERDGWVHGVGYLRPEGDGDVDRAVVDAILASWEWR